MSPEDLARRHPRLFHVADPDALPGILRHGLQPTARLLDLFEASPDVRAGVERRRRPESVVLDHPGQGRAVITDNRPLSEAALAGCLDDGLTPGDWLATLNARVFFWADRKSLAGLLCARLNRGRRKLVLELDTLGVARRHAERIELAAFNTGATLRKPVRRGLSTFTPMLRHSHEDWSRLRGLKTRDRIAEITLVGGLTDVADHLVAHYHATGGQA